MEEEEIMQRLMKQKIGVTPNRMFIPEDLLPTQTQKGTLMAPTGSDDSYHHVVPNPAETGGVLVVGRVSIGGYVTTPMTNAQYLESMQQRPSQREKALLAEIQQLKKENAQLRLQLQRRQSR